MDHVAEEVGLLRLRTLRHGDVRQHLLLQDLLGIPETSFAVEARCRSTVSDVVQGNLQKNGSITNEDNQSTDTNLPVLDDESFINTWFQHFQHLIVLHVIAYVLKDVAVRDDPEGTEDDPDWYVNLDVRDGGLHHVAQLNEVMNDGEGASAQPRHTERSWLRW